MQSVCVIRVWMLYRYRLLNRTAKHMTLGHPYVKYFRVIPYVIWWRSIDFSSVCCWMRHISVIVKGCRRRKASYMQIAESCFDALTTPFYWGKCNCRVSAIISRRNKYFNSFAFIVLSFWIFLYFFAHKMPCHILTGCGLKYGNFGNVLHHLTFPLTFRSLIYYFRHPTNWE